MLDNRINLLPSDIRQALVDKSDRLSETDKALSELGIDGSKITDRQTIREAANAIIERSVGISAAAVSALIKKMDLEAVREHSVAVDGSLYEMVPGYKEKLEAGIEKLLCKKIKTFLVKDGSGIGAAILAARNSDQPKGCWLSG